MPLYSTAAPAYAGKTTQELAYSVPRVQLPDVEQETRDYLATSAAETVATRRAFVLAMIRTGRGQKLYGLKSRVPSAVVARRRAANRVARATRQAQRRAA